MGMFLKASLISLLRIREWRPAVLTMLRTFSIIVYFSVENSGLIYTLMDSFKGWERLWIRLKPPSCLGTRPSGEQMYGGEAVVHTIRPSARSDWSFEFITPGLRWTDSWLSDRIKVSGLSYPSRVPYCNILVRVVGRLPGNCWVGIARHGYLMLTANCVTEVWSHHKSWITQ